MTDTLDFEPLVAFIRIIPGINPVINSGVFENDLWWIKFKIDITHPLAWRIVQDLGNILNYISVAERLASIFKPISPPVYLNGGPREYLSWTIESTAIAFTPNICLEWLEGRLPRPVDDLAQ
jgi:hypothetical protein